MTGTGIHGARSLVARASLRLHTAEMSVATLRAAIAGGAGGERAESLKRLLAERVTEADAARKTWEELKDLPVWQLEARLAKDAH